MPGFEWIDSNEKDNVLHLFDNGGVLFRHGFDSIRNGVFMVQDFEEQFRTAMGSNNALAVSSGTAALKVALEALDVGPGDEVITQSFTFVATVEAIVECGATPVITEIDSSLNMDPEDLERKITSKTKVIIPVHMLGTPAPMVEIMRIARENDLKVLEDTAWGCGAKLQDSFLGTIGDIGAFSFDYAKTLTTGEGGMVLTSNLELFEKAKAYHDHGHENNPNLPRWEDSRSGSGFNYRMSELQAAVGQAQLEKLESIVKHQRKIGKEFLENLESPKIEFRSEPDGSQSSFDAFVFFVESSETAKLIRSNLLANGFGTKILPEAVTWHFAATWDHIPSVREQLDATNDSLEKSKYYLSKAVALPISKYTDSASIKEQSRIILESCKEPQ